MRHRARRALLLAAAAAAVSIAGLGTAVTASAHGFTSVVYADVTASDAGTVHSNLELEYDLLVVSAADAAGDHDLFRDGTAAFETKDDGAMVAALEDHHDTVAAYVSDRFSVSSVADCAGTLADAITMTTQQGVPYAVVALDSTCAPSDSHRVTSTLFADDEGFVTDTTVVLTYDLDGHAGSAALDADHPTFSTEQSLWERFWEFFLLGAEHLLFGLDHILFLLALIAGSRRLREVVLAATAFTVAHSITFILAATGALSLPGWFVEPAIALSIAIVGAWHLWQLWRRGDAATELKPDSGPWGLDRAGWLRLGVVFAFGLVHGVGFAGALGIDEPFSWTLLWSLLVFNLGIEVVQLVIIAILFPLLMLLRRRVPRIGLWATGALAIAVSIAGLFWFVERIFFGG